MTERSLFPSSFDSTRYTGADRKPGHPNLAQAQAEAVTNLLMGRRLLVNNTYAFDSRIVLNLVRTILDTRQRIRNQVGKSGLERIDSTSPIILRWFGQDDFFSCCADQLLRLAPPRRRFILSHWKAIDRNDKARKELAGALLSRSPSPPESIAEHEGLAESYETLRRFDAYCRGYDRGKRSGGPQISLLTYLQDFASLERTELETIIGAMQDPYRIDTDTVMKLRESISRVDPEEKGNRSWAHEAVNSAGGEEKCNIFFLEQRQLVDTLYNVQLADSTGSDVELASSVPRTVGAANLERANAFALELIGHTRQRTRSADNHDVSGNEPELNPAMSDLFMAWETAPDLPAAPLERLLMAYWELVADDDRWRPWQNSCEELQTALEQFHSRGRSAAAQFHNAWAAHMSMLRAQLPHVRATEQALITSIELDGESFSTETQPRNEEEAELFRASMAAGQYVDRYLRVSYR